MWMCGKGMRVIKNFLMAIAWCLPFSWRASPFYMVSRLAVEIINPFLSIATAYVGKYLIDLLTSAWAVNNTSRTLLYLFAGVLILSLLRASLRKYATYCQSIHSDILSKKISVLLMERSLSMDLEFFDNPAFNDKLETASQGSYAIGYIVWNALSCISAGISFIGVYAVLCRSNMWYGLLMLAAAIPSSIASARFTKSVYQLNIDQTNKRRQMHYCQGVAANRYFAQDIRLFNAGNFLKNRYTQLWDALFIYKRNLTRKRAFLTGLLECLPEIVTAVIGVTLAFDSLNGTATVGDYSLYTGLIGQLWAAISLFSSSAMQIYDDRLMIDNFKTLDHFQNRITDTGTKQLERVDSVTFEHVIFTYPLSGQPVLNDICFAINRNEKVAFVGLNGSGKSTLIKLLLRLYEPDSGMIRVNGADIREYPLSALRAQFSVYFQDMPSFMFTLRDNFIITDEGRTDTDDSVKAALNAANCGDMVDQSPKYLDVGLSRSFDPDGLELSGGQYQKLALARTFYRRHTALILDEPSSNLDPKAEHEVFQSLQSFSTGKLTIFTSHRLSNVSLADRIIVLEHGRIIEDGTHAELMRNGERYAELFRYQQEKYL